jgi:hypothetical protein
MLLFNAGMVPDSPPATVVIVPVRVLAAAGRGIVDLAAGLGGAAETEKETVAIKAATKSELLGFTP